MSHSTRKSLLEADGRDLARATQADVLGLARSTLYYRPRGVSEREITLKHAIDRIYTDYPFYGSRRIMQHLKREGVVVNRHTIQRYMRDMGLEAIAPGPNLSKRHLEHRVYPYLLRNVTARYPDHIWGVDITYLPLRSGWAYLVAILDWYSRYVVSWEVADTLALDFVNVAVERALAGATPTILNSDQGSHFTSPQYTRRVEAAGAQVSMDGKGRALDNIFTERLWRTVKWENVYLADYQTLADTRRGLTAYFTYYATVRQHQSLDYKTPASVYFQLKTDRTENGEPLLVQHV